MALTVDLKLPTSEPAPQYLTLDNWKRGVITLNDQSKIPKDALVEADNLFLKETGTPTVRPGTAWYGTAASANEIEGADTYYASDGTIHLLKAAGGTIYRSLDHGATWSSCSAGTYTTGNRVNFEQNRTYSYITTGADNILRYDGTTTLQTYSSMAAPGSPAATFGGAGTTFNHYYKISAVNTIGFSVASASCTDNAGVERNGFDATTNKMTVTWSSVGGATRYDVFYSSDNVTYLYLGSSSTTTYIDDGTAIVTPGIEAPTQSTAQGPKVEELTSIGTRMMGVRDRDNIYRIWWTGAGPYSGYFASAYDGGYVDWQTGGKYIVEKVVDYRDGRGTPYATIWCDSDDGMGCILQMTLSTLTVGDVTITVPDIYKVPGSRGTPAPHSVVNVLNDYFFYNSQAIYNLGSRVNFQNLLSTDEATTNIRRTIKQISKTGESNIASFYTDGKVYISVPFGAETNTHTMIYDTEMRAWMPKAFTIGFNKFFIYTEEENGTKTQRLLAYKDGDTKLTEISDSIQGDYGVAFTTSLLTGLYPTTKNRFEFQWTEEGEVEFSNPQGTINIELLGIERSSGYLATNTEQIQTTLTNTGWSVYDWSTVLWSDASDAPDTYSESSVKRYFNVQKELNAIQWRITTSTLDANYLLRTLQSWGTQTNAGKPRQWKL